jgi:hypothetical protein
MGFPWRPAVGDERIDRCGVASVTVNDKGSHAPLRAFPRRPSTSAWDPSAARTLQNMSANLVRRGPWHREYEIALAPEEEHNPGPDAPRSR